MSGLSQSCCVDTRNFGNPTKGSIEDGEKSVPYLRDEVATSLLAITPLPGAHSCLRNGGVKQPLNLVLVLHNDCSFPAGKLFLYLSDPQPVDRQ